MSDTFHKLNTHGLETFQQWLAENQGKYATLPKHLIHDEKCYEDSQVPFDISRMYGLDLWEVGKHLVPIIDDAPYFHDADFKQVWSSLSLYFADLILPETYNGKKIKVLEGPRYVIEKGWKRYRHLIYSAYLCYKNWEDDSKYIISKNHTHSTPTDRFLGRNTSFRYPQVFPIIKKFYNNNKKIDNLMIMIRIIAINKSLHAITESELMDILPKQLKQQLDL